MRLIFIFCFAQLISMSLHAQQHKFAFDLGAGGTVQFFEPFSYNKVDDFIVNQDPTFLAFEQDRSNSRIFIPIQLGVSYEVSPWLNAQLLGSLSPMMKVVGGYTVYSGSREDPFNVRLERDDKQRLFELSPRVKFDALWKDEYEAFNLIVGFSYTRVTANFKQYASGTANGQAVDNRLNWNKHLSGWRWHLGLEWRDYFTSHFGYYMALHYSPSFQMAVQKEEFTQLSLNGTPHELEGEVIKYPNDQYPRDMHDVLQLSLQFGLTYKL